MTYEIRVEHLDELREAFKKAPRLVSSHLEKATKNAGKHVLAIEKGEVPVKTGALRRSITLDYRPITVSIYPAVKYAYHVHEGTGPHIIKPKYKKVLRFRSGGKWVYATRVMHPGTKANPFVERTVKRSQTPVNRYFDEALGAVINDLTS